MHMADGFISPAAGCTMWAASAAMTMLCARKVRQEKEMRLVPLMGVLGACQMLNFTIPGTGSSGHLGGGLILAILLGPYAGFLVMAAILAVQALFFADGGLLALGCNIFNMGFFSCLVAYPFIYRPLAGKHPGTGRITLSSVTAAVIGLQMGAFAVVLETTASGISALPFAQFVELMLPIHLAIGAVEGLATAAVVIFISKAQPSLLRPADLETGTAKKASWTVLGIFAVAALLCGAALSWFASTYPDGLEWSVAGVTGSEEARLAEPSPLHQSLETVPPATGQTPQKRNPLLPLSTLKRAWPACWEAPLSQPLFLRPVSCSAENRTAAAPADPSHAAFYGRLAPIPPNGPVFLRKYRHPPSGRPH